MTKYSLHPTKGWRTEQGRRGRTNARTKRVWPAAPTYFERTGEINPTKLKRIARKLGIAAHD